MARRYQKHRTYALEAALKDFGSEGWLDRLGELGEQLRAWRDGLIRDLGGEHNISTQQRAMVDLCCRTFFILEHIDRWMLGNLAIINRRDRKLFPVAIQRQRYADSLAKYLTALGLEKRQPPAQDLSAYLDETYGGKE